MIFRPKKLLALILAGLMILPVASCADEEDSVETKDPNASETVAEEDTGYKPEIEKTDYDADFIITGTYNIYSNAVVDDDYKAGDPFKDSIYERTVRIKDHLGVEVSCASAGDWTEYATVVLRSVQAGDDTYQLVATHPHGGISPMMTSGAMYDFGALDAVNLDAPYWTMSFMEELAVNDKYLIGYNDFCLSNTMTIVFNKDLMDKYQLTAPYEDVNGKTWTLDKLISMASVVVEDNGDNIRDENDTYGIIGWGWTDFISLTVGCGVKIVNRDENGDPYVAYADDNEKMLSILEKVDGMSKADYGYFWTPGTSRDGKSVSFSDGKALFWLMESGGFAGLREAPVRFGVLPYPLYDEKQEDYYSLSWNGVLMIPGSIKNTKMVGEVIELLAYYTAPVKVAYYEDLLGSKLAEAPEDAAMLDVIWDSQVCDIGLITGSSMLYMTPELCAGDINTYSSYLKTRTKVANKELNKIFNPKTRG